MGLRQRAAEAGAPCLIVVTRHIYSAKPGSSVRNLARPGSRRSHERMSFDSTMDQSYNRSWDAAVARPPYLRIGATAPCKDGSGLVLASHARRIRLMHCSRLALGSWLKLFHPRCHP